MSIEPSPDRHLHTSPVDHEPVTRRTDLEEADRILRPSDSTRLVGEDARKLGTLHTKASRPRHGWADRRSLASQLRAV